MDRLESSSGRAGSAVNDSDVGGSALSLEGASTDGSAVKLVKVCDTLISAGSVLVSTDSGSAVKSSLGGSALNESSPAGVADITFVDVSAKRRFSNADVGRANVAKRCLYGAACIVREALMAVKRGDYPLSENQVIALVEAEVAMTRLVDSWQKLPGSWQNREKNGWSRKSTSPVPTRVKYGG